MSRNTLNKRETQVSSNNAKGKQVEQTFTVDDCPLPSPQELQAYKEIDPRIVDYLLESSQREQNFRHESENKKINIIKNSDKRQGMVNILGVIFAFLAVVLLIGLTAYALYLDKPWFAGFLSLGTIASVVSAFTNREKLKK